MQNWPYPKIFAHRGGGSLAPENTLAAMKKGRELEYCAVEFDVKLTADRVAILLHDATLDRTTTGKGEIKDRTWDDLAGLDAGSWFSPQFAGERIPRFSEIAHYLHSIGMMANVEIKPVPGTDQETGTQVASMADELWRDRIVKPLLSSFSFQALEAAHREAPQLPRGFLTGKPTPETLVQLTALDCVSLHCNHENIDAAGVTFFHGHGYRVLTYTVNDPDRVAVLLGWGVDGIFTDNLPAMLNRFPHAVVQV